jgi:hypothetical protein
MEKARWLRTAQMYANELPANLRHLASANDITSFDSGRLAKWCGHNNKPLATAGQANKR